MVTTRQSARGLTPAPSSRQIRQQKRKKMMLSLIGAVSGVVSTVVQSAPHIDKKPMHTSLLTGERWVQELLNGK